MLAQRLGIVVVKCTGSNAEEMLQLMWVREQFCPSVPFSSSRHAVPKANAFACFEQAAEPQPPGKRG